MANSPLSDGYHALTSYRVGPQLVGLDLPLRTWASDGLLSVFFFVAGLELKWEFVSGELRRWSRAVVPVAATAGGVLVPAAMFLAVNAVDGGSSQGWAVPTAIDIAFALAVLAVVGRHPPLPMRTFLLTVAVIDDLVAITLIACFYTANLTLVSLLVAVVPLSAFGVLLRRGVRSGWVLLPIALVTWFLVHDSGVHATVAGVLLSLAVPVGVPAFALLSAGVAVGGADGLARALTDPVAVGVMAGLLIGKPLGVIGGALLAARGWRRLPFAWADLVGLATLAGIGFTVSMLIAELAFGPGSARAGNATVATLAGSTAAAALAIVVLVRRDAAYRRDGAARGQHGPAGT
jgi:NhaA family Na+:H+ antiporter